MCFTVTALLDLEEPRLRPQLLRALAAAGAAVHLSFPRLDSDLRENRGCIVTIFVMPPPNVVSGHGRGSVPVC